jgi:phosphoribosyl 1,2-cyclic phosphodiesterase
MALQMCILASGSSGNASILRTPEGAVLIDAGIGPVSTQRRLNGSTNAAREIRAIVLTHLDRDHFTPTWVRRILRDRIRVFVHASRVHELVRLSSDHRIAEHVVGFGDGAFDPLPGVRFDPIAFTHDALGSHGFVIDSREVRVGFATDLGAVPDGLIDRFRDVHFLCIEANYDPRMQLASPRPEFLKQRIMGGFVHLSNEQAFEAVTRILDASTRLPEHIVLLHRSRQCNCEHVMRRLFATDPRIAGRLVVAEQSRASPWLQCGSAVTATQLSLTFPSVCD